MTVVAAGTGATGPGSDTVRQSTPSLPGMGLSRLPQAVRSELRFWLTLLLNRVGDDAPRQRRTVAEAVEELVGRPDLRAWAMIGLGTPCGATGVPLSDHLRWLHRSLDLVPRLADAGLRALVTSHVAAVLVAVGDPAWRRLTDRILTDTRGEAAGGGEVAAYEAVAGGACYAGHHDLGRRLLTAGRFGAMADGSHRLELRLLARLALLDYCHGRWDGLRDRAERLAAELSDGSDAQVDAEVAAGCLALAHGDHDLAGRRLTQLVAGLECNGSFEVLPIPTSALIRHRLATGDVAPALETAIRILAGIQARGLWAPAARMLPELVRVMVAAGRPAAALDLLTEVWDQVRGLDMPLWPAASDHAHGQVAASTGQWHPAADRFLAAADRYEDLGCRYEGARARERAATCLATVGDPRAVRALRAALTTYRHLAAHWDLARATGTAHRYGIPVPAAGRPGDGDRLSPRQRAVAELAAAGLTNEEIARRLHLSTRTVDKHVCAALRKLGLHSRRSLGRYL